MGVVYRAFDPVLSRPVAIKVMKDEALATLPQERRGEVKLRFLQEARAAAKLSHPGITTIYQIEQHRERPYIVMEWLEGRSLEEILTHGPLTPAHVVRIGIDLANALAAAHQAGIVHRDIKPSNLILLESGSLKITDFGIARIEGGELIQTRAGEVLATPLYASPEQLKGQVVDRRSDVYSAGAVLYQLLTGRPPFQGATVVELATAVLFENPRPVSAYEPGCPAALEAVVFRALNKDPDQRFQTAPELADALLATSGQRSAPLTQGVSGETGRPQSDAGRPQGDAGRPQWDAGRPQGDATDALVNPLASRKAGVSQPVQTLRDLPENPRTLVTAALETFPSRALGQARIKDVLTRLLETPLHSDPFSGAVKVGGGVFILIHNGWIETAIDLSRPGVSADSVLESLSPVADASIFKPAEGLPAGVVPLLASLLGERKVRLSGLDSSLVNLPALAAKLESESFDGILSLKKNDGTARILTVNGRPVLQLFSGSWQGLPVTESWRNWISRTTVEFQVEEAVFAPAIATYRHVLRDVEVAIEKAAKSESAVKKLTTSSFQRIFRKGQGEKTTLLRPIGTDERGTRLFEDDPVRRFLSYLFDEMPGVIKERGKEQSLKYVSSWIPLAHKAALHHDLPRPEERTTDFFDAVTFDPEGKVLILVDRVPRGDRPTLDRFIEKVVAAKTARIKTGDVGGAILIAPEFDEETAEAYRAAVSNEIEPSRSWTFAAIESATNYEGFVRIGPRRGFHLLLVAETGQGFEIVLP
ncbi:MAG: Serine/threonine-protein kinase PknD [Thermoanaerobaculia bacterium]|nr:Serine/threonine-protein kinase PknD [Thermoanaerobaculia bacterium]